MSEQILIRNLPDEVKPALRRRAAENGRSVEAEARSILVETVMQEDPVLAWLDDLPAGAELPVPERRTGRDDVVFE